MIVFVYLTWCVLAKAVEPFEHSESGLNVAVDNVH